MTVAVLAEICLAHGIDHTGLVILSVLLLFGADLPCASAHPTEGTIRDARST